MAKMVVMDQTTSFWLDLFTWETWNEFLNSGGKTSGFREGRWTTVQRVATGDIFLCYLTGISRFVGVLEVTIPRQIANLEIGRISCSTPR
jgi:hypothetical protein